MTGALAATENPRQHSPLEHAVTCSIAAACSTPTGARCIRPFKRNPGQPHSYAYGQVAHQATSLARGKSRHGDTVNVTGQHWDLVLSLNRQLLRGSVARLC